MTTDANTPPDPAIVEALLRRLLGDADTGWHIGTFGGLAEFHHVEGDPAPPIETTDHGDALVTDRGGLRVAALPGVLPVAYEGLSGRADAWTQAIVFCLPLDASGMSGHQTLTELGTDEDALRPEDRDAILFDLGLGAPHVDFCVRTAEPALLKTLRGGAGLSIFDPGNPAMAAIKSAHPHRICRSRLGRVEVYQRVGSSAEGVPSPVGPHTHVLPALLKSGRTHSANTPIPDGWVPALSASPASAVSDRLGAPRPFDASAFEAFQGLLKEFGPPGYLAEKARIREAVQRHVDPAAYVRADTRDTRKAGRITLRQLRLTAPGSARLENWVAEFDRGLGTCEADSCGH